MTAIFKREMKAYFTSPLGYIYLAAVFFFGGYFFSMMLANSSSEISIVFGNLFIVITFLISILRPEQGSPFS